MDIARTQERTGLDKPATGLRTPGLLGRRPLIGIVMVLVGGLAFGALAFNLQTNGPLLQWDVPVDNSLHAQAEASSLYVREIMIASFYIGKQLVSVIAVILGLYYLFKRYWLELAMVFIGFSGSGVLWYVLSTYYNRPRPVFVPPVWIVIKAGSFPSGHTMSAVVCYGFLAYLWVPKLRSLFWKWVVAIGTLAIMAYIGYGRLFLGEHYLSDVIAGYALGVFWTGLVYTSLEVIFYKSRSHHLDHAKISAVGATGRVTPTRSSNKEQPR